MEEITVVMDDVVCKILSKSAYQPAPKTILSIPILY